MKHNILFSCVSHIGKRRSMNQDNFICDGQYMRYGTKHMKFPISGSVSSKSPSLFGVFDGMGGEECGEIASLIAAQKAAAFVPGQNIAASISRYCLDANAAICRYVQEHGLTSMGTTAAMLAFCKDEILLCNIGDSKVFRLSDGIMNQISRDHVAIAAYGRKPPLSQNLGIPEDEFRIDPYMARGTYKNGDIYLICSDGLTDMVSNDEIQDVLCHAAFDKVTKVLLYKALKYGGVDNITIIACKIENPLGGLARIFQNT